MFEISGFSCPVFGWLDVEPQVTSTETLAEELPNKTGLMRQLKNAEKDRAEVLRRRWVSSIFLKFFCLGFFSHFFAFTFFFDSEDRSWKTPEDLEDPASKTEGHGNCVALETKLPSLN